MPTGPSSALPASPSEITPFPGGGNVEPGEEEDSGRGRDSSLSPGAEQEPQRKQLTLTHHQDCPRTTSDEDCQSTDETCQGKKPQPYLSEYKNT